MFYYYGAKAALSGKYPAPEHPTIVEPFAGAAGYSMRYVRDPRIERVILMEKDQRVVALWDRLLSMTPDQVMDIPCPPVGERTTDFFVMTSAASNAMSRANHLKVTPRVQDVFLGLKRRVSSLLPACVAKVTVLHGDYTELGNQRATWFVDPPYALPTSLTPTSAPRGAGYRFGANQLNYGQLAEWCRSREGQVLVCEGEGADWLPFDQTVRGKSHNRCGEVLWQQTEETNTAPEGAEGEAN